jgi:hypothetical protein
VTSVESLQAERVASDAGGSVRWFVHERTAHQAAVRDKVAEIHQRVTARTDQREDVVEQATRKHVDA